ncbi:ATP-dependent DNA helicase RecG [Sanguibacter inulinus]|uniref:Probable DNA 3'-5' helicase RecG n=1 Tax=Sanguibacter inulinus TaxID=60922 RepID=A0A853EW55_9MICO|nr:ATP-dependent DNA helicase RecG [Sanguibacter inulinus]MBF0722418.1 ATP-dependent DNA helicase RecG [Sanguibacter inulinus]NYS93563.1 ATP-dependent DNA helicase RecG [Sanguibacter inulinus]
MSIDSPFSLDERLDRLLGKRPAAPLAKLGLETTGDLLRHYPRRYADPGTMTEISILVVGEHVTVVAEVVSATVREMRSRGGAMLQAVVSDGTDRLSLTFFAKHKGALRTHEARLKPGRTGLFTGVVSEYRNERQLTHPDYLLHGVDVDSAEAGLVEASLLTPIYPASAAMPTWKLHQTVRTVLDPLTPADIPDPIPAEVLERRGLESLHQAFRDIHVPAEEQEWRRGQKRLRYEEAFVLQTALALRRSEAAALEATARPLTTDGPSLLSDFDASLPFTLTDGQREVGAEIAAELAAPHPMQRLLQGEVGSGKTVVALRAMLQVVDAGGQAALLAPTEVLAAQHARTLSGLLGDLAAGGMLGGASHGTRVALVTGSQPAAVKKKNLLDAASGAAGIVVGTHALLSAGVQFAELGLVVVDEQHRFGVEQRDMLRAKARTVPHLLVMTATPIPRTVAMTVFGDLETSTLREIPAGRSGITTHVVPAQKPAWIARTWAKVREEIDAGRQAYVVCPRITGDTDEADGADEPGSDDGTLGLDVPAGASGTGAPAAPPTSNRRPLRAVLEVAEELADLEVLRGVRIGILHGQMPPAEKEAAMAAFTAGDVDLLVSTTVIEVGVDVPRATAMVVLDADRFGLSQLHQLRGRVGRGADAGLCFLVSEMAEAAPASTRLKTLASTTDGFELAAADLEMRSEGDVLGAAQSGRSTSLQLLRVVRDTAVIEQAREDAATLVAADPTLAGHPLLLAEITERVTGERAEYLDRS